MDDLNFIIDHFVIKMQKVVESSSEILIYEYFLFRDFNFDWLAEL